MSVDHFTFYWKDKETETALRKKLSKWFILQTILVHCCDNMGKLRCAFLVQLKTLSMWNTHHRSRMRMRMWSSCSQQCATDVIIPLNIKILLNNTVFNLYSIYAVFFPSQPIWQTTLDCLMSVCFPAALLLSLSIRVSDLYSRLTSLHPSPTQQINTSYFWLFPAITRTHPWLIRAALVNAIQHQHTSTTGRGMPYRRASMTHISHSGAQACADTHLVIL